jgi:hypothetical protein
MEFDVSRARLKAPDMFARYRAPEKGVALSRAGLGADTELIVFERAGKKRALIKHQMAYHHVAQGELGSEPYVVTF